MAVLGLDSGLMCLSTFCENQEKMTDLPRHILNIHSHAIKLNELI